MNADLTAASKIGFAAVSVLLVGTAAARADELAALRASQAALSAQQTALNREQELLKARIDQLAQLPNPGSNPGAPGAPTPMAPTGGGSFARSLLIPGTDTSIRVGGFIDESIFYYMQNGPANGVPSVTAEIDGNLETMPLFTGGHVVPGFPSAANLVPVNVQSSRGNGVFFQSPQRSRLNVETQTPTSWGIARTFLEIDFKGTNNFSTTGQNGQSS